MRPREPRRSVLIMARMRLDTGWVDVCIRNISSGGLIVTGAAALARGTYVEVRRGRHSIVARVAWAKGRDFGLQSRDRLPVDEILSEPDLSARPGGRRGPPAGIERRTAPRSPDPSKLRTQRDRARRLARMVEFTATIVLGALLTLFAGATVFGALAAPMAQIDDALAARPLR